MAIAILKTGFYFGPLLFGLLFIPPVTAQIIGILGWSPPLGMAPLAAGFVLGGVWGLYAQWRGSWLTWKL
ncbi:hypothetical protein HFP57_05080 [Parasphingopyxis algicola]|uniref:hypothetical protein n=1 Tax=Parasphingopyxis algicola TaxID=2026624 RepID=UPI0015A07DCE|nr:hypothetical protein [Parasphingopyxis algicola]QLC24460.1 hypothetical protein HFP57_05080 [Parasphingopyxis algicola]